MVLVIIITAHMAVDPQTNKTLGPRCVRHHRIAACYMNTWPSKSAPHVVFVSTIRVFTDYERHCVKQSMEKFYSIMLSLSRSLYILYIFKIHRSLPK